MQKTSPFDSSQSYCQWTASANSTISSADHACTYATFSINPRVTFLLLLLISIISIIIQIPLESLFDVLEAPLEDDIDKSRVVNGRGQGPSNEPKRAGTMMGFLSEKARFAARQTMGDSQIFKISREVKETQDMAHLVLASMKNATQLRNKKIEKLCQMRRSEAKRGEAAVPRCSGVFQQNAGIPSLSIRSLR